jgi:hypothetical protein
MIPYKLNKSFSIKLGIYCRNLARVVLEAFDKGLHALAYVILLQDIYDTDVVDLIPPCTILVTVYTAIVASRPGSINGVNRG